MDVSVCIVNWNTRDLLLKCLACLDAERQGLDMEVVVVDNASCDGSVEAAGGRYPWVKLVANDQNRYYATANNQAMRLCAADLVLLLNTDIEFQPGSVAKLVGWMRDHESVGAVAPKLVYQDGRLQRSCRSFPSPDVVIYETLALSKLFPRSRRFGKYLMTWWGYDDERPVEQPMASAFLVRAEVLKKVGLFDEGFPMFFNDVDLCQRIWAAGREIWFTPSVVVTHLYGGTTRLVRSDMLAQSRQGFLHYYEKHYRDQLFPPTYWLVTGLIRLAYAVVGARRRLAGAK